MFSLGSHQRSGEIVCRCIGQRMPVEGLSRLPYQLIVLQCWGAQQLDGTFKRANSLCTLCAELWCERKISGRRC